MDRGVYVLGAGGHAAVVIQTLRAMGHVVLGCYDDNASVCDVLGVSIVGSLTNLEDSFCQPCIVAIGTNEVRRRLTTRFTSAPWVTAIHPSAVVDPTAVIGKGAVVLAGAIVQARARIGMHVIVNTRSVVDHDSVVDAFAHVAQGAVLGGGVTVGEEATVGVGAVVESGGIVKPRQSVSPGGVVFHLAVEEGEKCQRLSQHSP